MGGINHQKWWFIIPTPTLVEMYDSYMSNIASFFGPYLRAFLKFKKIQANPMPKPQNCGPFDLGCATHQGFDVLERGIRMLKSWEEDF